LVQRVYKVKWDPWVKPDPRDQTARPALREAEASQGPPVPTVSPVNPVLPVRTVSRDRRVLKDPVGTLDHQEQTANKVHKDLQDHWEHQGPLVQPVRQDNRVIGVLMVQTDQQVNQDPQDLMADRDQRGLRDPTVSQALPATREQWEPRGWREKLDWLGTPDLPDPMDRQALKALAEPQVNLVFQVVLE